MATVELHEAFFWTCDNCGRDNFGRPVTLGMESELIPEHIRDKAAVEMSRAGADGVEFYMRPDDVTCAACGAKYDVEHDAE